MSLFANLDAGSGQVEQLDRPQGRRRDRGLELKPEWTSCDWSFPVVLGAGERLFGEHSDKNPMRLVDTKTIGDSLAFLTYELARDV